MSRSLGGKNRILSSNRTANHSKSKGKRSYKPLKLKSALSMAKSYKSASPSPSLLLRSRIFRNNTLNSPKSQKKNTSNSIFSYLPFSKPAFGKRALKKKKRESFQPHTDLLSRKYTTGNVRKSHKQSVNYAKLIKSHRSMD